MLLKFEKSNDSRAVAVIYGLIKSGT